MAAMRTTKSKRWAIPLTLIVLVAGGLGLSKTWSETRADDQARAQGTTDNERPTVNIRNVAEAHGKIIMGAAPEWATIMGAGDAVAGEGHNARLSDYSPTALHQARLDLNRMREDLKQINPAILTGSDKLTYDVMAFSYEMAARQNAFSTGHPSFLSANAPYAVNQLFGPQIDLPRLFASQQSVGTAQDADAWLSRFEQVERVLGEIGDLTEADAAKGVIPPYFALEAIAKSAKDFTETDVDTHPVLVSFNSKIDVIPTLSEDERGAYKRKARSIMEDSLYPAYRKFGARMRALIPAAGSDAGVWRLPDGAAMYQVALDAWGADGLTANEIHDIGLRDVERIHGEMDKILRAQGYETGSVGQRMSQLAKDPRYIIPNTDAAKTKLIEELQRDADGIMAIAPKWFIDIPDYEIEIRRIPAHEQDSAPAGYYSPPPLDGSRPGIFWINLKNSADVPTYTLKSLVFHEAVPGHHFQAGKSLSITDLPLLQNLMWFGDYGEGWALYAEELAYEMGMYEGDPLGNLGRYRMELYRAARLVVDTGLHHKRWSREKAIDYMVDVTGESRESITREVDRYAVWPGQATSYKLGMVQLQRMRKKAEMELGDAFDIREFHDVVLRDGAMPMATLRQRVDAWIESKKT